MSLKKLFPPKMLETYYADNAQILAFMDMNDASRLFGESQSIIQFDVGIFKQDCFLGQDLDAELRSLHSYHSDL